MSPRIGRNDLTAVLGFLEDARSAVGTVPFTRHLVDALTDVVGCEYARYREIDFARRVEIAHVPCSAEVDAFGADLVEMTEADWNAVPFDPCYRATFSEPTGIFIASDLASRSPASSEAADDWQAEFDRWDLVDRMWIHIGGPSWAGIAFDTRERAFGERERELARLLQPHLREIWRNASVRRRLRAALSALEHEQDTGVLLLDAVGRIEYASGSAQRILSDHFDMPAMALPDDIADWRADADEALVLATDDSTVVVEASGDGSALLLSERPPGVAMLTARERDVMRCVQDGLSNTEIARRLWIQPTTVRKHLEHVFDKLGVRSRTAALSKLHGVSMPKRADTARGHSSSSDLGHDGTTSGSTGRYRVTRDGAAQLVPCVAGATLGSGRDAIGVRVSPLAPLLLWGSFASGGYQVAYRMVAALAKAVAVATADSMIPMSTDMARLVWAPLMS
ncbi:MAG: LuxR C-terminal-related transcriptional regulator [Actinomycetota bacterium]|nr:LuxR C-terminal-related transcriptional regulator [Actinomycetota bacterium]